ncbi:MAG: WbqC family protein, partial [Bacteroidales bacterium]
MPDNKTYILPSVYFGPVQYFSKIIEAEKVIIEQFDTYSKQTYRNRCVIMSANGRLSLSIPVKKIHGNRTRMKDIIIDYDTNWQKDHKRGIISAYKSSPFFEFYFDEYLWVFNTNNKYLLDLNLKLTELILSQLQINKKIELSEKYENIKPAEDYREIISPKKELSTDPDFKPTEYIQVFITRHGFIP